LLIAMLADPVLKEPNRRAVAPHSVAATPVTEHLDDLEQIGLGVGPPHLSRAVNSAVYSCFGIFFTSRASNVDVNHRPLED
jgi:hypothetical protein